MLEDRQDISMFSVRTLICSALAPIVIAGCSASSVVPASSAAQSPAIPMATKTVACGSGWQVVPAIDVAEKYGDYNSLNGVTALSPTNIWAVGQYHRFASGAWDHTLIEHWNGKHWIRVSSPNSAIKSNILTSVAAVNSNDIWAVGYSQQVNTYYALIEHWDGKTWSIVPTGSQLGYLTGVTVAGPDDVVAVGSTNYVGNGIVYRWNGHTLKSTKFSGAEILNGVTAISPNDIWVVGFEQIQEPGDNSFAIHYDGKRWTRYPTPNPLQGHYSDQNWLTSVAAVASNNVWATGVERDVDYGELDKTFSLHWNGKQWQLVSTPNPSTYYNDLWSSVAQSNGAVEAIGQSSITPATFQPLAASWSASKWVAATMPAGQGVLLSITAARQNGALWATGNRPAKDAKGSVYTGILVERGC